MKFWIDGSEVEVGEGGMLRIPPDAEHCGAPIGEEIVMNLDVFSPIREKTIFTSWNIKLTISE